MKLYLFGLLLLVFSAHATPSRDRAAWATAAPPLDKLPELLIETASVREQSLQQLFISAGKEENFISHSRPEVEWTAWRLAHLYRLKGKAEDARAAAALLAGLASRELPVPPDRIHIEGKWIPYPAVIAYGLIQDADIWPLYTAEGSVLAKKETLESWLDMYAGSFSSLLARPGQITNYTPFGLRHAAALALVRRDSALMKLCLDTAVSLAFSPEFWTADHIWQEGTVSYARQVTGNLNAMLPMLQEGSEEGWIDPEGKVLEQLEQRLVTINEAQTRFRMPSGRPVPVHDTHWRIPPDSLPRASRALAFPDFGHFSLPGPDQELHLSIPVLTGGGRYGGGHVHDSRLSIQLWAHGQEVLPDAGYPFYPANHRYFHMSPYAHNTAIALHEDAAYAEGPYGVWKGDWARSSLLGYDNGESSGGTVNWISASSPGPETDGISESVRQLVQVRTGTWTGYVVDAFWLQGGQLHRWFLRQSEDEAMEQSLNVPLQNLDAPNMAVVLGDPEVGDTAWTAKLRSPSKIDTEENFDLTWRGLESGVSLRVHLAPQPGSSSWLSSMPRVRPTLQDPEKRDDFPGWHLFRQRQVDEEDITLWAAVYEPVPPDGISRIQSVDWQRTPDGEGLRVEITLNDNRTNVWFLQRPGGEGIGLNDHHLHGQVVGLSLRGEEPDWTWAAAGSRLMKNETVIAEGTALSQTLVLSLKRHDNETRLRIKGKLKAQPDNWGLFRFQDGSGRAVKIGSTIKSSEAATEFHLETDPGFRVDEDGMNRIAFPPHAVAGEVIFQRLGGTFIRLEKTDHF